MLQIRESENEKLAEARLKSLCEALEANSLITLIVEPSSKCNLACTFCAMHSGMRGDTKHLQGEMTNETFRRLVDQLAASSICLQEMQLHGFGEPLLNKKLPDFVSYAKKKDVARRYRVTTNGTVLTPNNLESLVESGVTEIHISVDVADAERYAALKGKRLFDKLDENIWNAINVVNADDRISLVIKYSIPHPSNLYGFTDTEMNQVIQRYSNAFENSERIHARGMTVQAILDPFKLPASGSDAPCEFPFYSLYVKFDGTFTVCCADFSANYAIGNINEQGLDDILHSDALRAFRLKHVNGDLKDMPMCYYCEGRSATDISTVAHKLRNLLARD